MGSCAAGFWSNLQEGESHVEYFLTFVYIQSFLVIGLVGLASLFLVVTPNRAVRAVRASLRDETLAPDDFEPVFRVLVTMRTLSTSAGYALLLVALVRLFRSLHDPSFIGPAMVLGLTGLLYAAVIGEVLVSPLANRLALQREAGSDFGRRSLKTAAHSRSFMAAVVGGVGLVLVSVLATGELGMKAYINPPSITLIVVGTLLLTFSHVSVRDAFGACRAALMVPEVSCEQARRHLGVLSIIRHSSMTNGFLLALMGQIMMLRGLHDPAALGPALAICAMNLLYGLVAAELVLSPLMSRFRVRVGIPDGETTIAPPTGFALVGTMGGFTLYLGCIASMSVY